LADRVHINIPDKTDADLSITESTVWFSRQDGVCKVTLDEYNFPLEVTPVEVLPPLYQPSTNQ
jgi:hypothetical protein